MVIIDKFWSIAIIMLLYGSQGVQIIYCAESEAPEPVR
jgi:hypothetical protein